MAVTNKDLGAKIDKIEGHLGRIDVTLGKQATTLEEHIRRTALLEKAIEPPIRLVTQVDSLLKTLGFVFAGVTAIATLGAVGHYLAHLFGII